MNTAIEIHGLTKDYGSRRVVNGLSLSVPEGCVYGFLGRNGAGKSTTIKMLMGLVQPSSGTASLMGHNIAQLPPEVRGRIAYLAEGHPLYSWMTVQQAINFAKPFYARWNDTLVGRILEHFELSRKQKLGRLSKGQQAQVSLALAVAPDPDLLILDDPTLGLDTVVRRDFLESMIQIIQRRGRTILFSSHVLGDVERVADHIGIMVQGVLRVNCPVDQFKQTVRQIVLHFPGTPPAAPSLPGLVNAWSLGRRLELVIVNFQEIHREAVENLRPNSWEISDFNLEDAFIAYTRGPRRALPLFTDDAAELQEMSG